MTSLSAVRFSGCACAVDRTLFVFGSLFNGLSAAHQRMHGL